MTLDQISARIIGDLLADARFTYADHRLLADVVKTTVNSLRINRAEFLAAIEAERQAVHKADLAAVKARLMAAIDKATEGA